VRSAESHLHNLHTGSHGRRDICSEAVSGGTAFQLYLSLTQLEDWSAISPFNISDDFLSILPPKIEVKHGYDVVFESSFLDNHKVKFISQAFMNDRREATVKLTHDFSLVVESSEPASIEHFENLINCFRRLFTLLINRPVFPRRIQMVLSDVEDEFPAEASFWLYPAGVSRPDASDASPYIPLTYAKLRPALARIIAAFTDAYFSAEQGPSLQLITGQEPADFLFNEDELITLTQAAESFHRASHANEGIVSRAEYRKIRASLEQSIPPETPEALKKRIREILPYANEPTLKSRILDLCDQCPSEARDSILKEIPAQLFARRLSITRNYLTHYSRRDDEVLSSDEYPTYNARLRALLRFLLLERFGVDQALLLEALKSGIPF
jgi:hypothetical protein